MSLCQRLLFADEQFLVALDKGPAHLDAFNEEWSSLLRDVEDAFRTGSIDDSTIELAFVTATRLQFLANSFIDLYEQSDALHSALVSHLDEMFAQLSLEETETVPRPSVPSSNVTDFHTNSTHSRSHNRATIRTSPHLSRKLSCVSSACGEEGDTSSATNSRKRKRRSEQDTRGHVERTSCSRDLKRIRLETASPKSAIPSVVCDSIPCTMDGMLHEFRLEPVLDNRDRMCQAIPKTKCYFAETNPHWDIDPPVVRFAQPERSEDAAGTLEVETHSIEDWFNAAFNGMEEVIIAKPTSSLPLEVEFFTNWGDVWGISSNVTGFPCDGVDNVRQNDSRSRASMPNYLYQSWPMLHVAGVDGDLLHPVAEASAAWSDFNPFVPNNAASGYCDAVNITDLINERDLLSDSPNIYPQHDFFNVAASPGREEADNIAAMGLPSYHEAYIGATTYAIQAMSTGHLCPHEPPPPFGDDLAALQWPFTEDTSFIENLRRRPVTPPPPYRPTPDGSISVPLEENSSLTVYQILDTFPKGTATGDCLSAVIKAPELTKPMSSLAMSRLPAIQGWSHGMSFRHYCTVS